MGRRWIDLDVSNGATSPLIQKEFGHIPESSEIDVLLPSQKRLERWELNAVRREKELSDQAPANCPFCAGNEDMTPPEVYRYPTSDGDGWHVRVIPNKFPALKIEGNIGR